MRNSVINPRRSGIKTIARPLDFMFNTPRKYRLTVAVSILSHRPSSRTQPDGERKKAGVRLSIARMTTGVVKMAPFLVRTDVPSSSDNNAIGDDKLIKEIFGKRIKSWDTFQ